MNARLTLISAAALALSACGQGAPGEDNTTPSTPPTNAAAAHAHDVTVSNGWVRPAAEGRTMTAGYFTISNTGVSADTLLSASSPDAKAVEIHESATDENGVSRMRPVEHVEIAPGETLSFAPGGYHLMIMGLTAPIQDGDTFPVTLTFEKAGAVSVDLRASMMGPA